MKLGTRGSKLALTQAQPVADALGAELVTITTSGDAGARDGDKARWVDAIESALVAGEVDLAVHSAKDVPGELAPGLGLVAMSSREDVRDALVGAASLEALSEGARVGTSSLRRRAQLLAVRPDLEVVDLHGNVDTRLRKLDDGEADAIVLAAAGLLRLGLGERIGCFLDPSVFVPAPGQGALAIEGPVGHEAWGAPVNDERAAGEVHAERALCHALGATCHTPIGAWHDGSELHVFVGMPDGSRWIRDRAPSGQMLERLESVGVRELLADAEAVAS
ncbi:hydroxymethylbilane synthase [Conexibacter sp. SYSU D00693]|uniref:hydroxymethylbilane synthase n=1 Tax=Conexibacter sp. SYSU D00693 TaxID=2812560 RepID=UPI00196B78FF|nr:hydroxymethylbilane synthase [Conexibacter sp. SYSU D00693]